MVLSTLTSFEQCHYDFQQFCGLKHSLPKISGHLVFDLERPYDLRRERGSLRNLDD